MDSIIDNLMATIISLVLLSGGGLAIKEVHDFVRYETLKKVSEGLSSSEKFANALTGEKLSF